jgi:hypothetical protein
MTSPYKPAGVKKKGTAGENKLNHGANNTFYT